jgi:integrase
LTTWLAFLRASGRRPKTLQHYEHCVSNFHAFIGHALSMATRAEPVAWAESLAETHAPPGRASFIRSARAFYNWLAQKEVIDRSPFARMKISVPEVAKRTPDASVIDAVIAKARGKRDRCVLILLADTACRKGEAAGLTVEDVDIEHGFVFFRESKTRRRPVVMSDRLILAVGRWLRQRGTANGGSFWDVGDPYSLISAAVERASGGTPSPHDFRRAFAVRWLEAGMSEVSLQRVAGWISNAMIRTYTAANPTRSRWPSTAASSRRSRRHRSHRRWETQPLRWHAGRRPAALVRKARQPRPVQRAGGRHHP